MKRWLTGALLLVFGWGLLGGEPEQKTPEALAVPTLAVLPFEARGRQAENNQEGRSVAELVSIALQESGSLKLVERAELDKVLDELQLSASGLTDPATQLKLARIVGARLLVAGSCFQSGEKRYLVAKVIGSETSRVLGCSVSGSGEFTELTEELARKLRTIIEEKAAQLLPRPSSSLTAAAQLAETVKGGGRKIYLKVNEDIRVSVPDPAAETELKKLLLALGFEVVGNRDQAEFALLGEAVAEAGAPYRKFLSASARVELSVYQLRGDRLLASGAARETMAGGTYVIAAKQAIAQATLRLAEELLIVLK